MALVGVQVYLAKTGDFQEVFPFALLNIQTIMCRNKIKKEKENVPKQNKKKRKCAEKKEKKKKEKKKKRKEKKEKKRKEKKRKKKCRNIATGIVVAH